MNSFVMEIIADVTEANEGILQIKRFLSDSISFELLSLAEMRLSSRGSADTIGMSEKNLPSFGADRIVKFNLTMVDLWLNLRYNKAARKEEYRCRLFLCVT